MISSIKFLMGTAVTAVAVTAFATAGRATTITAGVITNFAKDSGIFDVGYLDSDHDGPFAIAQFDPSLGTLNAVDLSMTFGASNIDTESTVGNYSFKRDFFLKTSTQNLIDTTVIDPFSATGAFSTTSPLQSGADSGTVVSALLPDFVGTGTIDLTFFYTQIGTVVSGGTTGGLLVIEPGYPVTYTIKYDYTAAALPPPPPAGVPEPASAAIFGAALVGLGLARRGKTL